MKYCEKCQAFREDKFAFCNKCGTPLVELEEPVKIQPADAAGIVCSNCGTVLAADMRFCNRCGTPVSQPESVQPSEPEPVKFAEPEPVPQYTAPLPEIPEAPASQYTSPLPEIPPMPAGQTAPAPAPQGKKPNLALVIILTKLLSILEKRLKKSDH